METHLIAIDNIIVIESGHNYVNNYGYSWNHGQHGEYKGKTICIVFGRNRHDSNARQLT